VAPPSPGAPVGVLLFNLGGPDTLDDVEPFLVRLFSDREIIELPGGPWLQPLFARLIARKRGPEVRRNDSRIGGGSPQRGITSYRRTAALNTHPLVIDALAAQVTRHLQAHG
jgi:ferrochelatase